jgi:predicted RNA methylase
MGKRSDFKRIPRDFYPTPMAAVVPLICHLSDNCRFWEPCAGDGALVYNLEAQGANCVYATDIHPMAARIHSRDALTVPSGNLRHCDYIITNPPWDRKILHPMIEHFSAMRPTWLLFDADWMHTRQSAPFMPYLRKIVSVGRVKWIPDSKMTGKDNCAWYLFDQNGEGATQFYGRT